MTERIENGTVVKVTASDYDSRRLHGDLLVVKGYSKTYDSYYVQSYEGQTCCFIGADKIEVVDWKDNPERRIN